MSAAVPKCKKPGSRSKPSSQDAKPRACAANKTVRGLMPRFTKRPRNGGNQDKRKCSKRAAKISDLEESENTQSCCKSEARIAPADRESAFNFVARVGAVGEVQSLCLFDSALLPGPCAWIAESDGSWFSGGSPPSIQSPHAFDGFLITEKTWLPSLPATTLEQDTQEEGVPCQEGTEMKSPPCSPLPCSSLFCVDALTDLPLLSPSIVDVHLP